MAIGNSAVNNNIISWRRKRRKEVKMSRASETRGTRGTKAQEERKNMRLVIRGNVTKLQSFGKKGEHAMFTLKEKNSGVNVPFKFFNMPDDTYDSIADGTVDDNGIGALFEVEYNIGYSTYKDITQMQLCAYRVSVVD